jgi:hypothetical protein
MARLGEQVSLAEANLQYLIEEADRRPPSGGDTTHDVRNEARHSRRPGGNADTRQGRRP